MLLMAGTSRSKACSTDVRDDRYRHSTTATTMKTAARTNRSMAKTRRMSLLRISLPRGTSGAAAAGPDLSGGPGTNAPHRRHCQASPSLSSARTCARSLARPARR